MKAALRSTFLFAGGTLEMGFQIDKKETRRRRAPNKGENQAEKKPRNLMLSDNHRSF